MPATILFRADADEHIGIGHVMRGIALAEALQALGWRCALLAHGLPQGLLARLSRASIAIREMDNAPIGSSSDAQATIEAAQTLGTDRIVVDGYEFGPTFLEALRSAGMRVAVIDDHAVARVAASRVTLNQNIFAPDARPEDGYLSGPDYVLLRRDLIDTHKTVIEQRNRLLVTLGGADPDMVTEKVIEACALDRIDVDGVDGVDIVVGSANPRTRQIQRLAQPHDPCMRVHVDVPSLSPLLATARLAVVAAGGTMWEALHWGVPMITVHRDAVQQRSTSVLLSRGLGISDLDGRTVSPPALAAAIFRALAEPERLASICSSARRAVDGKGAARVARAVVGM